MNNYAITAILQHIYRVNLLETSILKIPDKQLLYDWGTSGRSMLKERGK